MIDIHNHILFDADDGCKKIDGSLNMIKEAINLGITEMVLTPHYSKGRNFIKDIDEITNNFYALKERIAFLDLPMKIHLGREIDRVCDIVDLIKSNKVQPMNGSKFILIDFGGEKCEIDEYIYDLVVEGYKPIIAHPERYTYVKTYKEYHRWKQTGAYLQLDAESIFIKGNKEMKKVIKYLLKNKMVDFIASDTHKDKKTLVYLKKAYKHVSSKYGKSYANQIFNESPMAIVNNY